MLIFLLTPFDTRDYFESGLSLMLLINGFLPKKYEMFFCSLLNMDKQLSLMSLFLHYFIEKISSKKMSKVGVLVKR